MTPSEEQLLVDQNLREQFGLEEATDLNQGQPAIMRYGVVGIGRIKFE